MSFSNSFTRAMVVALVFTLIGVPEVIAQSSQNNNTGTAITGSTTQAQNPNNADQSNSNTDPRFNGVKPDPSAGPQSPTLTPQVPQSPTPIQPQGEQQLPSVPAPQTETNTNAPVAQQPVTQRENPVGTATAEKGVTRGGAASKPAGTAIAPAKQRQVRSLLIKLGVVAAAGVAVGTVMGLSKGTPTSPPGAPKASTPSR